MRRFLLALLLVATVVLIVGCQEQQSPQHPTTAAQMANIEIWAQKTESNLIYLYKQVLDPNDPNSLACRVEALESEQRWTPAHSHVGGTIKKKKGGFGK